MDKHRAAGGERLALWFGHPVAQLSWYGLFLAALITFVLALPARFDQLLADPFDLQDGLQQLGLSTRLFSIYGTGLDALTGLCFFSIALLTYRRKPSDRMVWLISLGFTMTVPAILPVNSALAELSPTWELPILALRGLGFLCVMLAWYAFPNGRLVPGWTRLTFLAATAYVVLWIWRPSLAPPTAFTEVQYPEDAPVVAGLLFWSGTVAAAQWYRYRYISGPVERQQTKWVVFVLGSILAVVLALLILVLFTPAFQVSGAARTIFLLAAIPITLGAFLAFPVSITLAIMRYRLWDIDILIRRTLIYGALTGTLAMVYFVGIVLLQRIFSAHTQLSTVLSTLAIAALFSPLRRRIQNDIDRLFYRRKFDAEQTLADFGATLRQEVNLEELSASMLDVVNQTMQPQYASLWLTSRDEDGLSPTILAARRPTADDGPVS